MFFVVMWMLLLGAPLLVYLGLPLWSKAQPTPQIDAAEARMQTLFLERERSYTALLDLDEDYEAGKLSKADYQTLRAQLLQETAELLRQLETSGVASIEAEIERYRREKWAQKGGGA
jgi:hypothetical protein